MIPGVTILIDKHIMHCVVKLCFWMSVLCIVCCWTCPVVSVSLDERIVRCAIPELSYFMSTLCAERQC